MTSFVADVLVTAGRNKFRVQNVKNVTQYSREIRRLLSNADGV